MPAPIAAVVGALGSQGSSVVSALASKSPYRIRALTSNAESPAAVKLSNSDSRIEVVQADLLSIDSLVSAFTGAAYIYANTVFRPDVFNEKGAQGAQDTESTQGLNIVRAVARVNQADGSCLKHIVWSTLPNTERASEGKLVVPHLQSKIAAEKFLLDEGNGLKGKTTFLRVGMYGVNLARAPYTPIYMKGVDKYFITLPCSPNTTIPMVGNVTPNLGLIVDAIFRQPELSLQKYVLAAAEYLTAKEWVQALSKVCGKDIVFLETNLECYEGLFGPAGRELGLMMKYIEVLGEGSFAVGVGEGNLLMPRDLGLDGILKNTEDALGGLDWEETLASGGGKPSV
ncbi:uncharacterized protein BDV14DRAFT_181576 [Aspergillus stella-maris]|uniref:uncharacterized protein n=1 Tax=Aspergillus stella-maris TaxID=1810926 RepID=UPI003CCE297A